MLTPNIEGSSLSPTAAHWLFAGHSSANAPELAARFAGEISAIQLAETENSFSEMLEGIDAAALIINAKTGVSKAMIDYWNYISERQFPRLVIVSGLEMSESDFDDIVMIANRVLEQVVTPFLVLHDELGEPSGLIELSSLTVHDYSGSAASNYPADDELRTLVSEFKTEADAQFEEFGDSGFAEGLLVPALPVGEHRRFGIIEIQNYLNIIKPTSK